MSKYIITWQKGLVQGWVSMRNCMWERTEKREEAYNMWRTKKCADTTFWVMQSTHTTDVFRVIELKDVDISAVIEKEEEQQETAPKSKNIASDFSDIARRLKEIEKCPS